MNPFNPATEAHHLEDGAEIARALGHTSRLALLTYIAQGERSVERLAELSGMSVANTSQHLQQLRRAGLVQTRRDGKRILYRLGDGPVVNLLIALNEYARHQRNIIDDVIQDSRYRKESMEAISVEELLVRMQTDNVLLLDVRPVDEYSQGHLPNALNIPADELKERMRELPLDMEIVAYCRGPYCVLSSDAVAMLQVHGVSARRLCIGYPQWKAAGLKVES